jgi:hypothetical protein
MASTDKAFALASAWSTAAALFGIAVLPLLPPTKSGQTAVSKFARTTSSAPVRAQKSDPTSIPASTPSAPAAPTVAEPPPAPAAPVVEAWTEAEQAATLRECLRLLAPVAVEIAVEDPVKRGQCGTPAPLSVRSIGASEKVELSPPPTMNCRLAAELAGWVETVLQPTAREVLGTRVTQIVGASSYSCRNIYNMADGPLSLHATGAAIDIAGFVTADGRSIRVAKAWGPTERDIAEARRKEIAAQASAKGDARSRPRRRRTRQRRPTSRRRRSRTPPRSRAPATSRSRPGSTPGPALDRRRRRQARRCLGWQDGRRGHHRRGHVLKRLRGLRHLRNRARPRSQQAHRDHFHV